MEKVKWSIGNDKKPLNLEFSHEEHYKNAYSFMPNKDYFKHYTPQQPKLELADYADQNDILTPSRFNNLEESLKFLEKNSEKDILVRSECSEEYLGASGLLESFSMRKLLNYNQGKIDFCINGEPSEISKKLNGQAFSYKNIKAALVEYSRSYIENYCYYKQINTEEFIKNISYSFWRGIPGMNRSIIADSAIPGRYHIVNNDYKKNKFFNYICYENEKKNINTLKKMEIMAQH